MQIQSRIVKLCQFRAILQHYLPFTLVRRAALCCSAKRSYPLTMFFEVSYNQLHIYISKKMMKSVINQG